MPKSRGFQRFILILRISKRPNRLESRYHFLMERKFNFNIVNYSWIAVKKKVIFLTFLFDLCGQILNRTLGLEFLFHNFLFFFQIALISQSILYWKINLNYRQSSSKKRFKGSWLPFARFFFFFFYSQQQRLVGPIG